MADQKILTGNAVPSADPRDRHDNSIGLDEAVTSKLAYWTDRLGIQRRTLHWMETAATGIPAIEAAERAEAAAAAAQMSAGIFDDTAKGLAGTTNGKYFTVPQPGSVDAMLLYKNNAGVAQFITAYSTGLASSLTMNIGKLFPQRRMVRNGVDSPENVLWSKFVAGMTVVGAEEGYLYRLGYFVNSVAGLPGADPNGWVIERVAEKDYATANNPAVRVVNYDAPGPVIGTSGLQTITLVSPIVKNLRFVITVDPAGRPPLGTSIGSLTPAQNGYSHIIDPSVYIPAGQLPSTLNLNAGQDAPFKRATRGGVTLDAPALMRDAITAIRVVNAKPGMYYGLRYFQNRNAAVVPAADNWIIEEVPQAGYADSVITSDNSIATLQDNQQPAIDRALGMQTITLQTKTDVKLLVTIDPSKLPAAGTPVAMNGTQWPGYSHIIDPACYEMAPGSGGVSYSINKDKKIRATWDDGSGARRGFDYGKNGANDLGNFAAHLLNGKIVTGYTTDWNPPVVIDAAANGDSAGLNFTGGNHEVGGKKTAFMTSYDILADGAPVAEGSSGRCEKLVIRQVNRLMAGNTVSLGRYVADQILTITIMAGGASVECEFAALENLHLYIDYGPQMVTGGAGGTLYYLEGKHGLPIPFDGLETSGKPSEKPNAWASCYVYGDGSGQLSAWIDRSYGIADAKNSSDQYGLIIGGGPASTKQYPTAYHRFLARNPASPNHMELKAGASYKWRGGYSWQPVRLRTNAVATMDYVHDGRLRRVDAYRDGSVKGADRDYASIDLKGLMDRKGDNTFTLNKGKVFPFNSSKPRAGVIEPDAPQFREMFLDVQVLNADPASLYRVAYVAARANSTPGMVMLGFRIEKMVKADYETTGTSVIIHNYTADAALVKRDSGMQTFTFECDQAPGTFVKMSVDSSALPADGGAFLSANPGHPGRSWYVDESRYTVALSGSGGVSVSVPGVYYDYKHDLKELRVAYASGNWAYRVLMKRGAINQLFDINTVQRAPLMGPLAEAAWQTIPGATEILTDYFPPMVLRADNNPDADPVQIYTGGSHGSDGAGGGQPTAKLDTLAVFADGAILDRDSSGYCERLTLMMVNHLMGWNTWKAGRYIGQQHYNVGFSPCGLEIHNQFTAFEDVTVSTDNGPQCYFGGFNDTQMIPNGMEPQRVPLDSTKVSGNKIDYPNVWIVLMRSTYGTQAAWVDRNYEAGDGRYVSDTANFIRGGGGAKFYNAIVAAKPAVLAAGESYKWRGGFHFMSNTNKDGYDSRFSVKLGQKTVAVMVTEAGKTYES